MHESLIDFQSVQTNLERVNSELQHDFPQGLGGIPGRDGETKTRCLVLTIEREFLEGCLTASSITDMHANTPMPVTIMNKVHDRVGRVTGHPTMCIHRFLNNAMPWEVYLTSSPDYDGVPELLYIHFGKFGAIGCSHSLWINDCATAFVCNEADNKTATGMLLFAISSEHPIRTGIGTTFRHQPIWRIPEAGWATMYSKVRDHLAPLDNDHGHDMFLDARMNGSMDNQSQTIVDYRRVTMLAEPNWHIRIPVSR